MNYLVDAHLDLAYNALRGRAVTQPAIRQTPDDDGIPSVGLPDLRAGNVGLICATIFCEPATWKGRGSGYETPDEAHAQAIDQLQWYVNQEAAGELRIVHSADQLPGDSHHAIPMILLMEGSDALREVDDVILFHKAGLRMVGLAWKRTRHAGGTGAPGPLTGEGVELVKHLDAAGIIHDVSHLAEESFWQLLDQSNGPVVATHSNCRRFIPTDRHLSDEMIRAIVGRGGVIGINFYDRFLLPPEVYGKRRATLDDVILHIRHICDLAGNANHVAIGTDMDGGFGKEQIPVEIATSADLPKVGEALGSAGFTGADVANILGRNWVRFFEKHLK